MRLPPDLLRILSIFKDRQRNCLNSLGVNAPFVTARMEVHSFVCLFIRIIILDLEEDL